MAILIIFSVSSFRNISVVRDSNLATSTRNTLDLQFISTNRFNNLSFRIFKTKNTTVIIIKNHYSGHVRGSKLTVGLHDLLPIFTFNFYFLERFTILATKVRYADIKMFIFFKDIIIKNFQGNHLLSFTRAKS